MKNIVLVGFMGTGKTSVGQELAKKLKKEFIELDELIEQDQGEPIDSIFKNKGETYFRQVEKDIARRISDKVNAVISTGGGIVLDEENIKNLKKNGLLFCLQAKPEIILERVKYQTQRPLLKVENQLQRIKELLNKREVFYKKADFCLDTSNMGINEAVDKIIEIYSKDKNE